MKRLFLLVAITIFLPRGYSQNTGVVRGFVYDKASGEALPFCNVFFKGTNIGASTDLNGYFNINRIQPGNYILIVTSLDYDSISEPIHITAGSVFGRKYFANKGGTKLEEVEVTTNIADKVENTSVAVQKIDPIVINKLPSVGEPDIAQYLQVLPGVVFTGDQGGQLYIRGGLPVQNKVLLDGLVVYNPFHSIGLFSVFDTEIMKNANVYSAGFGAEYGGRTSSIMDITTRDGNKKRIGGKLSASTFGVKATLEGPLVKLKANVNTSASYIVSLKHSYLPQTSKLLYKYANDGGLPFHYTDIYGKASLNSLNGSKLSLYGFNFNDKVNYSSVATFAWHNTGIGSNFVLVPQSGNMLIEGVFAYSLYKINFINPLLETDSKSSNVTSFNTGFTFIRFIGIQELRFGFEGIITNTNFQLKNPRYSQIEMERSTTDIGAFIKHKFIDKNKRIVFEPSFRLQYYATLAVVSPEPRAALKVNFTKKLRFKASGGLYSQTLMSASSDRDIVNLFYGFINAPENEDLSKKYVDHNGTYKSITSSLQKATHIVAGFEFDLFKQLDINIEAYQKFFNQIINTNRDKVFDDNTSNTNRPDGFKKTFIVEQGRTRGIDFALKYDRKRFYFWAVYSLTFNNRWAGNISNGSVLNYPPNFDRRHNVNLVTSYVFGKKRNWEFNARWNFGTGFPFTQTQGYINTLDPAGNINYNFSTANGPLNYIPASLNGGRLPDYHRLDLGVKYKYKWNEKTTLEINMGATNIYNRENIFYVDRFTFDRINQLPVIPNLNLSFAF